MSKLILIRHGQASFNRSDYDQLSPLGVQQAKWLGAYFAEANINPTRIITGDLKRHLQTTEGIIQGLASANEKIAELEQHTGWNEFDFHMIGQAYLKSHPEHAPDQANPRSFFSLLRKALRAWSEDQLEGALPETWICFQSRVLEALNFARKNTDNETVLVISSGGAISMALQHIMGFDNATLINLNLQTRNTGFSEIYFNGLNSYLASFNAVSHLETAKRRNLITYA